MRARCPNCKTLFRVSVDQVDLADGLVRCGQCLCVFRARADCRPADQSWPPGSPLPAVETEIDTGDSAATDAAAGATRDSAIPAGPDGAPGTDPSPTEASDGLPALRAERGDHEDLDPGPAIEDDLAPANSPEDTPELMLHGLANEQPKPERPRWMGPALIGANLVLLLAVLGQFGWYERERLARIDWLRPWVLGACETLGCQVPEPRDLDSIQLLDRSVSSHPSVDSALIITATMVNNAPFQQPYPLLMVSMSDIRGQIVARRHFAPDDYLDADSRGDGMIPGAPVAVVLEVTDPGGDALTFELEFF